MSKRTAPVRNGGSKVSWTGVSSFMICYLPPDLGDDEPKVTLYLEVLSGILRSTWIGSEELVVAITGEETVRKIHMRLTDEVGANFRGELNLTVQECQHNGIKALSISIEDADRLADANALAGIEPENDSLLTLLMAVLLLSFFVIGVLFYSQVEKWNFSDSMYFCVVVLTTVGYGDMLPTTPGSKMFTVFFALFGIGLISNALGLLGSVLIDNQTQKLSLMMAGQADEEKSRRHCVRVTMLIGFAILMGILFFSLVGGLSFIDSLYVSVITLTTIGFGDLSPFGVGSHGGLRWFGIVWLLFGTICFATFVGFIIDSIVDQRSQKKARGYLQNRVRDVEDLDALDLNKDKKVTETEWLRHFLTTVGDTDEDLFDECVAQFRVLDRDKSGFLSKEDFSSSTLLKAKTGLLAVEGQAHAEVQETPDVQLHLLAQETE